MATAGYETALATINARLDAENAKRDALRVELDAITAKIDAKVKFAPKKPLYSYDGYNAKIQELEERHRSARLSMKDEKDLIRNIEDLKRARSVINEYTQYQEGVDKLYQDRKNLQAEFTTVMTSIKEFRSGARKLEIMIRVIKSTAGKVDLSKITTEDVTINEEIRPRLIGKKGAGLKTIEETCAVNVDIEEIKETKSANNTKANPGPVTIVARITGLPQGIVLAKQKIAEVAAQEEVTFTVSPPTVQYLLGRGGTAIHELEERFGVNVRLAKDEGKMHVRGHTDSVNAFKQVISEGERSKTVFSVDSRVLPAVIGKGGANLKKLYEDTHVQIDISKPTSGNTDNAGPASISLVYIGEHAAETIQRAKDQVLALINENTEVDEVIPIPRDAVSWLVGNNGDRIRTFSKAQNVYARTVRKDESPDYDYKGADAAVVMRGTREALNIARPHFVTLMQEFSKSFVTITITAAQARVLIGPGGAGIRKLRADTGAQIEIDEATGVKPAPVTSSSSKGNAATNTKKGTVATETKKGAAAVETKKEAEPEKRVRINRADEVGLPLGSALVMIRAEGEVVISAQNTIRAIIASLREIRLPISGGLINTLMKNKGEVVHGLETETGALINVVRDPEAGNAALAAVSHSSSGKGGKLSAVAHVRPASLSHGASPAGVVTLAGTDAQVSAAEAKIIALASAKAECSFPIPDTSAVGEIVGKSGANLRAIQDETGTEIDIDKDSGLVRITGAPSALAAAEEKLRGAFDKISRENTTLTIDKSLFASLIGKGGANVKILQDETGAQIHADSNKGEIRIHGPEAAVAAARARVLAACKLDEGSIADIITVDPTIVGRLIGKGGGNLRKLEETNSVSIGCDTNGGKITVRGTAANVAAAKTALRRQVREASRIEDTVTVPQEALGGIIGTKGSRLRALENACHVSIDLPRERTGKQSIVTVRGSPVGLQKGKAVLSKLAAGHVIRALPRSKAMVDGLNIHNLHGEAGVSVTTFGAEPVDPVDVAEGIVSVSPHKNSLILVDGKDAASVSRVVSLIDRSFASRYGTSYQITKVPSGIEDESSTDDASSSSTASSFTAIKADANVGVQVESEGGYVAVWGDAPHVKATVDRIVTLVNDFSSRHAEIAVEQWMVGGLVGSKGANIQALEKETGLKINLERNGPGGKPALLLSAPSISVLSEGSAKVTALVNDLRKRRIVLAVPSEAMGSIIGKGGAVIRSIQDETGANIDASRDIGSVAIRGPNEKAVADARARIEELVSEAGFDVKETTDEEIASMNKSFTNLFYQDVDSVIGPRGASIRALETEYGVTINANRDNGTIFIRSEKPENVNRAYVAVESTVKKSQEEYKKNAEKEAAKAEELERASQASSIKVTKPTNGFAVPIGGNPSDVHLTKNARRRAKRKEKRDNDGDNASIDFEPVAVPVVATKQHAPIVAPIHHASVPVHVNHTPALVVNTHVQQHAQQSQQHHVVPPTVPVHTTSSKTTQHRPTASSGEPTADQILAQILGNNYQNILHAAPANNVIAPTPVTVQAARPPPGFTNTTSTSSTASVKPSNVPVKSTTTTSSSVTSHSNAASSTAPVWGSPTKPTNSSSNPTADDILAQLNFPGLVLSTPVTTTPAVVPTASKAVAKPPTAATTKPATTNTGTASPARAAWGTKK